MNKKYHSARRGVATVVQNLGSKSKDEENRQTEN